MLGSSYGVLDDACQLAIFLPVFSDLSDEMANYPTPKEIIHSPQMTSKESEEGAQSAYHAESRCALRYFFKKKMQCKFPATNYVENIHDFPPKSSSRDL